MSGETEKPVRCWLDGCFDLMHWGHANAIRQAFLSVGRPCQIVVGVHSDAEIERQKGPCIMKEQERYAAVRACRWVDEVVEDVPYSPTPELLVKHHIDLVVHGDDVVVDASGAGCYDAIMKAGVKFHTVPRTDGVSTTDLISRMLNPEMMDHFAGVRRSMLTARKVREFTAKCRAPTAEDKIVYVDGDFDLFHVGHSELFRKAKELGTFLIVGVHDDEICRKRHGRNYPIMNLHERVLGVLSCRYVDDVVIGAPWEVTKDMVTMLHASVVVHGKTPIEKISIGSDNHVVEDPYREVKEAGLFVEIESGQTVTALEIVDRVNKQHAVFEARNKKKAEKDVNMPTCVH